MSKHTPGPWEVDAMARDYMNQLAIMGPCPDQGRKLIANGAVNGKGNKTSITEEQLANAAIIAAAPELLKWATEYTSNSKPGESAADYAARMDNAFNELRAAIAKAQGGAA